MPIEFRCTGCRSRLHVPKRWAGNSLPCPKCGTRVVVPTAVQGDEPTAFEDAAVERSIASLQVREGKPGGIFAADSFELPSPDEVGGASQSRNSLDGITLSRRAIYAYGLLIPSIAAAAFWLGCWWTANGGR
jgi:hypothetical protein